jgi:hypothetical protein
MDSCKESWLLFFDETIHKFVKGYEIEETYSKIKKNSEKYDSNSCNKKIFELKLGSFVNKLSKTKNETRYMDYLIQMGSKINIVILRLIISHMILKKLKFNF